MRRVTMKEVAAKAGVSIATVSNVFSGRKPVNAALRQLVNAAAEELAYDIDRFASQLRSGQTRIVGVLVPDLDDVFFSALVSQLEVLAQRDGFDILIASSRDDVEQEDRVCATSVLAAFRSDRSALLGHTPADTYPRSRTIAGRAG